MERESEILKFKKLTPNATSPIHASPYSAGFDLFAAEDKVVHSQSNALIKTDIAIELPPFTYGRIAPRSSLALSSINILGGVIDRDYTGGIGVIIFKHSINDFKIQKGHRIAQLIIEKICIPKLIEVDYISKTDRGEKGFGSSGK